ncbi:hypothetical protein EDD64_13755 [Effusibacillus lacus]|nr:hypothetical protein EDD64_13755 [Effusibacillus lacus]
MITPLELFIRNGQLDLQSYLNYLFILVNQQESQATS